MVINVVVPLVSYLWSVGLSVCLCRVVCVLLVVAVVCWLVFDTAKQGSRQLVSFSGLLFFVMLMLVFSRNPFRVWQTNKHKHP